MNKSPLPIAEANMNVRFLKSAPALVVMAIALPAAALDLTVTQFGQAMFGAPFAVARARGPWLKDRWAR